MNEKLSQFDKSRRAAPPPSRCLSAKVAYRKKRQAKREADRLSRLSNPRRRPNLRPYQCGLCGMWHLTSKTPMPDHIRSAHRDAEAA